MKRRRRSSHAPRPSPLALDGIVSRDVFDLIASHLDWRSVLALAASCRACRAAAGDSRIVARLPLTLFGTGAAVGTQRSALDALGACVRRSCAQRRGTPQRVHYALPTSCAVRCVAWSGDGARVLVGEMRGSGWTSLRVPEGAADPLTPVAHYALTDTRKVNVCALLGVPHTPWVLCGASRPHNMASLFDERNGTGVVQTYAPHSDSVFALAATEALVVSGGGQTDCKAHVCDFETAALLATLPCKGSVRGVHVQGSVVTTASLDGVVRLWDVRSSAAGPSWMRKVASEATCHGVHREGTRVWVTLGRPRNCVVHLDSGGTSEDAVVDVVVQHDNGVSALHVDACNVVAADYDGVVSVTARSASSSSAPQQCFMRPPSKPYSLHSVVVSPRLILHAAPDNGHLTGLWF